MGVARRANLTKIMKAYDDCSLSLSSLERELPGSKRGRGDVVLENSLGNPVTKFHLNKYSKISPTCTSTVQEKVMGGGKCIRPNKGKITTGSAT